MNPIYLVRLYGKEHVAMLLSCNTIEQGSDRELRLQMEKDLVRHPQMVVILRVRWLSTEGEGNKYLLLLQEMRTDFVEINCNE